eukprot:4967607-Amphidinium_carterae.3
MIGAASRNAPVNAPDLEGGTPECCLQCKLDLPQAMYSTAYNAQSLCAVMQDSPGVVSRLAHFAIIRKSRQAHFAYHGHQTSTSRRQNSPSGSGLDWGTMLKTAYRSAAISDKTAVHKRSLAVPHGVGADFLNGSPQEKNQNSSGLLTDSRESGSWCLPCT